jgi:hypothetical protein
MLNMEKIVSESSFGLVLWQILSLVIQIGVIILLYKLIVWIFKKRKEV